MKKFKNILLVILAAGLLVPALAACRTQPAETPSTKTTETPGATGQPQTQSPGTTGQPTTAPEGTPVAGGTLNLYGIDPHTLDPAVSGDSTSHQYILQIFSGLLTLDKNLEPAPDIASEWKVSNGGKTYTFHLRHDVKFQDGRQVKAQDFKYSWERAASPATRSQTASSYLGDIVGVREVLTGQASEISGIKVIDDFTLEVNIAAPRAYFLAKMTYPTAFVVDRNNVSKGRDWWKQPNGTGPFKLTDWRESQQIVIERNGLYYRDKAYLDSVVFHLFGGVPMNLYETGQIDATSVGVFNIDRASDPQGGFYDQLRTSSELSFYYIGFNHTEAPFDDADIRKAFIMAVDKQKIASLVFRDMAQPADGILPPGMPGFNDNLKGLSYDPAAARELINKSSYGSTANLPAITLTTAGQGGGVSSDLEAIITQWRENLGVEVKVRQLQPERFFYYLKQEKDQLFDIGWIADYPHPQDFLEILFRSGSDSNYGEYGNSRADALLDQGGAEIDQARSFELYRQAEQLMVDDAAVLPLWFGKNYLLVKPNVKGYALNPVGLVDLSKVWLESKDNSN